MKKVFDFGKIAYNNRCVKDNLVTVTVEYEEKKPGQWVFSASGDIWNRAQTDILCGGQCLDTIAEYITNPTFQEIYRLWQLYHLNDMHPECEHQARLGWRKMAAKKLTFYKWQLSGQACVLQLNQEKEIKKRLLAGESVKLSDEELALASLKYYLTTYEKELPEGMSRYYEPAKNHIKTTLAGHTYDSEHPEGMLCKPCPVCGYKYGSAWNYFPIAEDDHKKILELLK